VLVFRFCAVKLITSNECIAQGAPSFKLVRRRKYSEQDIVTACSNNSLGLIDNDNDNSSSMSILAISCLAVNFK